MNGAEEMTLCGVWMQVATVQLSRLSKLKECLYLMTVVHEL